MPEAPASTLPPSLSELSSPASSGYLQKGPQHGDEFVPEEKEDFHAKVQSCKGEDRKRMIGLEADQAAKG